jgi:hypothetical protein
MLQRQFLLTRGPTRKTPTVALAVTAAFVIAATVGVVRGAALPGLPALADLSTSPAHVVRPSEPTKAGVDRDASGSGGVLGGHEDVLPGTAGGELPEGATVFDDYAGVTRLDPYLLSSLREAALDAQRDGVNVLVNSGWRSADYQEQLLDEAVAQYGSRAEAARWVATPTTSAHVSGDAVDLGPAEAQSWLSAHGGAYGLCQIYQNEPWHYELRPSAATDGCPAMYDDAAHDPRTQQ